MRSDDDIYINAETEVDVRSVVVRVDLKLVIVYYIREVHIYRSCPVPSAPSVVKAIDELRFERFTSNIDSRFEKRDSERWFENYEDSKEYARKLCREFKKKTLATLRRQGIPESAIRIFHRY